MCFGSSQISRYPDRVALPSFTTNDTTMLYALATQRLFPLCGQLTRMVMSSSSRVIRPASSTTALSKNTRMRDNFDNERTKVPNVAFSTWRYYSPINNFLTITMPMASLSRSPRFVTLVGDTKNKLSQRGFATKKVRSDVVGDLDTKYERREALMMN